MKKKRKSLFWFNDLCCSATLFSPLSHSYSEPQRVKLLPRLLWLEASSLCEHHGFTGVSVWWIHRQWSLSYRHTHVDTSTLVCTEGEQVRSAETSCEDRFTTKGLVSETNQWRKIMRRCSFSSRKNVFFLTDVHKAQNWERSKGREMEMIRESSQQEPVGKRTEK